MIRTLHRSLTDMHINETFDIARDNSLAFEHMRLDSQQAHDEVIAQMGPDSQQAHDVVSETLQYPTTITLVFTGMPVSTDIS